MYLQFDERAWNQQSTRTEADLSFVTYPWKWVCLAGLQNGFATVRINGDTRADYGKPQYQGPKVLHWWWSNRQWVLIEMSVQRSWTWRPGRRAIGRRRILNGVRWVLPVVTLHLWHGGEKNQSHKYGRSSLFHQLWSESLRQTFPAAVVTLILLKLFLHLTDPEWSFFIFDQVFDHGPDSSAVHGLLWFDITFWRMIFKGRGTRF